MSAYRRLWRATCIVSGALGVAVGVPLLPVELACTFIVVSVTAGLTVAIEHDSRRRGLKLAGSGRWIRIAAVTFAAWVAVIGLGQVLGVGFFLLVLILTASSPAAMQAYRRRRRVGPEQWDECATTSTAQLCYAWGASYGLLQRAESPGVRLRIIAARQEFLDELERRDPDGFNTWLASAASTAGSPEQFIAPRAFGA